MTLATHLHRTNYNAVDNLSPPIIDPHFSFVLLNFVLVTPVLTPAIMLAQAFKTKNVGLSNNDHKNTYKLFLFERPPIVQWDAQYAWFQRGLGNRTLGTPGFHSPAQQYYGEMNPLWNVGHVVMCCAMSLLVLVPMFLMEAFPAVSASRVWPCCTKEASDSTALRQLLRIMRPKTSWDDAKCFGRPCNV